MSISDFLFEGRPPPSTTTYGQTVENMPKWLSDYTQGLISRANTIAAEPYQPYGGPRIAGFSPEQEQAFSGVQGMQGEFRPALEAGQGALGQAGQLIGQGTASFPGAVQDYMDPYIENVLNRQQTLSQRNLEENFLPSLQDAFTRAGHFGSDRMMELGVRGTRDIAEGLQGQQLGALSQAYGQAGQLFGADRARELEGAGRQGQLAGQYGALGQAGQSMGLRDLAALESVGGQRRGLDQASLDLGYGDFQRQRDYPRETLDWMSSVVRGLPYNRAVDTTRVGPADVYQPSGAQQLGALASAGAGVYDIFKKARGGVVNAYKRGGAVVGPLSLEYA